MKKEDKKLLFGINFSGKLPLIYFHLTRIPTTNNVYKIVMNNHINGEIMVIPFFKPITKMITELPKNEE